MNRLFSSKLPADIAVVKITVETDVFLDWSATKVRQQINKYVISRLAITVT